MSPKFGGKLIRDGVSLLLTIGCATLAGKLFYEFDIPAPYLLGSMLGVWFVSVAVRPMRSCLYVPRWFHKCVVLSLGVLVGAMFEPESIEQLLNWTITLTGMLIATVVATCVGYWYLTRLRGYDPVLALFCAIPGGQAEVILLSREFVDKDYVVALCHLIRVVVVFCSVPLALALIMGEAAVQESNRNLTGLPSLIDLPASTLLQFLAIALIGFTSARLIGAPVPYLMGPLFLSMALHLTGYVDIPRISEFVLLAQVTIGGAVGARLGQVEMKVLGPHIRDALINVSMVLAVFVGFAFLTSMLAGIKFFNVMLAFVPGGLYEITLLTLVFGFDVAFVAVHHATRMLFILLSLPGLIRLVSRRGAK